jgi:hypothetical protein
MCNALIEEAHSGCLHCLQGAAPPEAALAAADPAPDALVGLTQPGIARLVIDAEGPEPIAEVRAQTATCVSSGQMQKCRGSELLFLF